MYTYYWVISFWLARFLEVLGLARRVEGSQPSTSRAQAKDKKRAGSNPLAARVAGKREPRRETVLSWAGNPVSAGGVARQPTLSV